MQQNGLIIRNMGALHNKQKIHNIQFVETVFVSCARKLFALFVLIAFFVLFFWPLPTGILLNRISTWIHIKTAVPFNHGARKKAMKILVIVV